MMKRKNYYIFICILVLSNSFFLSAKEKKTLLFTKLKGSEYSDLSYLILQKAYQYLNYEIKLESVPSSRSLLESNSGNLDGEIMRIAGIDKKYPNLIMIKTSLISFEGVVYSKKNLPPMLDGWNSIKPYSILIIRGIQYAEDGTKGMEDVLALNSYKKAFELLEKDRYDLFIASRLTGLSILRTSKHHSIKIIEPPLVKQPLYHYLHKKNKDLVEKIDKVLIQMHERNEIELIKNSFKAKVLNE